MWWGLGWGWSGLGSESVPCILANLPVSFISGLKEYGPVYRALPEASLQVHVVILLAYERFLKD